jgi:hypothetical protein
MGLTATSSVRMDEPHFGRRADDGSFVLVWGCARCRRVQGVQGPGVAAWISDLGSGASSCPRVMTTISRQEAAVLGVEDDPRSR